MVRYDLIIYVPAIAIFGGFVYGGTYGFLTGNFIPEAIYGITLGLFPAAIAFFFGIYLSVRYRNEQEALT